MMRCVPKFAQGHLVCSHAQHAEERVPQTEALRFRIEGVMGESPWRVTGSYPLFRKGLNPQPLAIKHDSLGHECMAKQRIGLCRFLWKCLLSALKNVMDFKKLLIKGPLGGSVG